MSIRITLNGQDIMVDSKDESRKVERESLGSLLWTKSTDSTSAEKSANALGGLAYAEILKTVPADSVVEVYETPEVKNAVETIRARYTVKAIINRVIAASTQADRQGEIFTEKTEKTEKSSAPVAIKGLV